MALGEGAEWLEFRVSGERGPGGAAAARSSGPRPADWPAVPGGASDSDSAGGSGTPRAGLVVCGHCGNAAEPWAADPWSAGGYGPMGPPWVPHGVDGNILCRRCAGRTDREAGPWAATSSSDEEEEGSEGLSEASSDDALSLEDSGSDTGCWGVEEVGGSASI
jgi:hypothetical protein